MGRAPPSKMNQHNAAPAENVRKTAQRRLTCRRILYLCATAIRIASRKLGQSKMFTGKNNKPYSIIVQIGFKPNKNV